MNKLFEIVWCFLDRDNFVETDDWGDEVYHVSYIKARNEKDAIDSWRERKSYRKRSEICEINTYELVKE